MGQPCVIRQVSVPQKINAMNASTKYLKIDLMLDLYKIEDRDKFITNLIDAGVKDRKSFKPMLTGFDNEIRSLLLHAWYKITGEKNPAKNPNRKPKTKYLNETV